MHGQHTRNGRQRPFEERTRNEEQQAGGRSERHAQERDREQFRAGYPAREWERHPESYRNVRSEPDWDPSYRRPEERDRSLQANSERGYASQRSYGAQRDYAERHPRDFAPEHPARGFAGERGAWGSRGYDQGLRDDRWRADDAFSEPGEYHEPTRYEPGGFPQGLRPAGGRDWRSERDLREPRHHTELGQRLEDAGRRLVGKVKGLVRNPKNYKRSDERIREDICDRLAVSPDVDPTEIEVTVDAGEVTLTGVVVDRQMKFIAEDIADDIAGVHEIHNQLRVKRGQESGQVANSNAQGQAESRGRN